MNNFIFYSPTEFVFGRDTETQTGALVQKYGARKVMIVYGGGSVVRSGLLARVEDSLQKAGIPYCMLGGVQPNPIDTKVYEGIDLCRKENVDMMLAVGGGSVIDTAKAIAAGVPYDGDFWDFYIGKSIVAKALKVAVVLTIPAAGSEGSGNTVITKVDGLQKLSLRAPGVLRPVFAVMNPELTYTLPPFQTALWHCRYDGAHYGALLYQYKRSRDRRPPVRRHIACHYQRSGNGDERTRKLRCPCQSDVVWNHRP